MQIRPELRRVTSVEKKQNKKNPQSKFTEDVTAACDMLCNTQVAVIRLRCPINGSLEKVTFKPDS